MSTQAPFRGSLAAPVVMRLASLPAVTSLVAAEHIVLGWVNADEATSLPGVSAFAVSGAYPTAAGRHHVEGDVQLTVLAKRLTQAVAIADALIDALDGATWSDAQATYRASVTMAPMEQPGGRVNGAVVGLEVSATTHAV